MRDGAFVRWAFCVQRWGTEEAQGPSSRSVFAPVARCQNIRRRSFVQHCRTGMSKRPVMFGFDRITFDPAVMAGRACIRDTRVPVSLLVNLVANGMTPAEIIESYPYLEPEDIQQALQYAAYLTEEKVDSAA